MLCPSYFEEGRPQGTQCYFEKSDVPLTLSAAVSEEASDYIVENTVINVGGNLYHTFDLSRSTILLEEGEKLAVLRPKFLFWWLFNYVGHSDYKGGWFTYLQDKSGPQFQGTLECLLIDKIDLIFFGPEYRRRFRYCDFDYYPPVCYLAYAYSNYLLSVNSPKPISREDLLKNLDFIVERTPPDLLAETRDLSEKIKADSLVTNHYDSESEVANFCLTKMGGFYAEYFGASHLVKGPKHWYKKGYEEITHPPEAYADQLAIRLVNLGFPGYASCDECEVFLSHETQKSHMLLPKKWNISDQANVHPFVKAAVDMLSNEWMKVSYIDQSKHLSSRTVSLRHNREENISLDMYTVSKSQWVHEARDLFPFVPESEWEKLGMVTFTL